MQRLIVKSFKEGGKLNYEMSLDISKTSLLAYETGDIEKYISDNTTVEPPYTFEFYDSLKNHYACRLVLKN